MSEKPPDVNPDAESTRLVNPRTASASPRLRLAARNVRREVRHISTVRV